MTKLRTPPKKRRDWSGISIGARRAPGESLVEHGIRAIALSAIVLVLLIVAFVLRESLPVFLGRTNSAADQKAIPPSEMDSLSPAQLRGYLELSEAEFRAMDRETLGLMMEVKAEAAREVPADKDSGENTTRWRYLLGPHQWTGYDRPSYVWQPVSEIQKFNIVPLLVGSLKTTLVALLFAVPLSLGAAIYTSQLARPRAKEFLKPAIEMLAAIPSVVLGFFALIVMATFLQKTFGYESRLNAFVAGIALGLAIIPVVFSIAEDALTSVPRSYAQAALALGASKAQAAWQVVLPAALPGVFAAVALGFGRAMGETMIVLMASGNASILSWDPLDSTRTITATIAAELAEAVFGGHHYRILFMLGTILFALTFLTNLAGDLIIHNLKEKLEGKT